MPDYRNYEPTYLEKEERGDNYSPDPVMNWTLRFTGLNMDYNIAPYIGEAFAEMTKIDPSGLLGENEVFHASNGIELSYKVIQGW